jgi:thiamine biosynthesis lipoprotein ApbE
MSTPLRPTRRVALATGLGTLAALATGCSERGRFFAVPGTAAAHHFSGQSMGSSYNVKLAGAGLHDTLLRAAEQAVGAALQATVAGMSHYEPGSELSRSTATRWAKPLPLHNPCCRCCKPRRPCTAHPAAAST